MNKQTKIIGIIGGMGPFASSYFYNLLLNKSSCNYGAKNNDDFPEILIDSIPVPDFISDTNRLEEAKDLLISRVRKMNNFGIGVMGMVCNTGHLLYPELVKYTNCEFVSLIELVADRTIDKKLKRVGILATRTTIKSGLYKKALRKRKVEAILPTVEMQKAHEVVIREVLAGNINLNHKEKLRDLTKKFVKNNKLDGIILGCTELPLVFPKSSFRNVIDCLDVLSDNLLSKYYSK